MARVAGKQHGNVTRGQLLELGLSPAGIGRRISSGVLHPVYRGVYRLGHRAPNVTANYAGAVLAGGEAAALAGFAAAHQYGLWRGDAPAPEVLSLSRPRIRGVIVHRVRRLDERDVCTWHGMRVVTVPRLLVDLAGMISLDVLARVHYEARIRFGLAPDSVDGVLARRPNSKGIAGLRAVVHGDTPVLLSRLERGFHSFLKDERFPCPSRTAERVRTTSTAAGQSIG